MKNIFKNKSILITGASGTIGYALFKSLLKMNCKVIRGMSNDENGLFEMSEEIFNSGKNKEINSSSTFADRMIRKKVRILYGDVRDYKRCLSATKGIDIVIHAAAVKHIAICQFNPIEATKTNVEGTRTLIKASIKNNVKKFLLISTDKAVDPTSVMGISKLEAEKITQQANYHKNSNTKLSCIRFGNIIGSRGSVIPLFINQIRNKNSITITNEKMTRFFMSLDGAVNLIKQSLYLMRGNEIFILKTMKSFKIIDVAIALNHLLRKNKRKNIKFIGRKPGEKIYESLFSKKDNEFMCESKNMFIINKNLSKNKMLKFYKARVKKKNNIYRSDNPKFILKANEIKKFLIKYLSKNY